MIKYLKFYTAWWVALLVLLLFFSGDIKKSSENDQLTGHFQSLFYYFFRPLDPKSKKKSRKSSNKKNPALVSNCNCYNYHINTTQTNFLFPGLDNNKVCTYEQYDVNKCAHLQNGGKSLFMTRDFSLT